MMKRVLAVAFCLGMLPGTALAQSNESSLTTTGLNLRKLISAALTTTPFLQTPDWQSEYNTAITRKAAGKRKMLMGAAVFTGGLALALFAPEPSVNDCVVDIINGDDCGGGWSTMVKLGALAQLSGAGISGWGLFQYHDANNDMRGLESRRPPAKTSGVAIPVAENQTLRLSLGQQKSLRYSMSW